MKALNDLKLPRLIDSHAHIDEVEDVCSVVTEAKHAGIIAIVVPGQNKLSNQKVLQLSEAFPGYLFPCIGYHPWNLDMSGYSDVLRDIDDNLPGCFALGEVGLDYKAKTKKSDQKLVFALLLELAKKHNKPVIIHTRYVHETTLSMVHAAGIERAVFHGYNGSLDVLDKLVKEGYYISAAPSVCYNEAHAAAVQHVPLTNLLLETDTPVTWRYGVGRPIHTGISLRGVAELKGISLEEVAEQTVKNTIACFGLKLV